MIFSNEFLFIHVPKTAGMSITNGLLKSLDGKVYYAVQEGHARSRYGETVIAGRRHQTLAAADAYFQDMGLEHRVANFRFVMSMVRNPYEMEVSRFHYLRKGHAWDKGLAQKLALAGDFASFVEGSTWWFDFRDYYTVDGLLPENLYIVRYEDFEQTVQLNFAACFRKTFKTRRMNKSHSTDYRDYYSRDLEDLVYKKYQWIFDKGYYSRAVFNKKAKIKSGLTDLTG